MSEKSRHPPTHIGPSVNPNPVAKCSTEESSLSISVNESEWISKDEVMAGTPCYFKSLSAMGLFLVLLPIALAMEA